MEGRRESKYFMVYDAVFKSCEGFSGQQEREKSYNSKALLSLMHQRINAYVGEQG